MAQDDRFYAFIVAGTSRSRSQIRRICVEKKALKIFAALVTDDVLVDNDAVLPVAAHVGEQAIDNLPLFASDQLSLG